MTKAIGGVLVILAAISTGCASASVVRTETGRSGRVALEGPYMVAMGKARVAMAEECGGRFQIVEDSGSELHFVCRLDGALASR